jgi:hypothetical protein
MRVCKNCGWEIEQVLWTWEDRFGFTFCTGGDDEHVPAPKPRNQTVTKVTPPEVANVREMV